MRRDQLEHAIRTACQIIGHREVIVIGSQSILGTFRDDQLPAGATMSIEVDLETSALPEGRRGRLVKVQNTNTAAPSGEPQFTGWCLDKEDLCVAKLCALREKDRNFVAALVNAALVNAGLVDVPTIMARLATVAARHRRAADRTAAWLRG